MELDLVRSISAQLPRNTVVQLHNNGDAFLYPHLGEAISLFRDHITNTVTNGKLLLERFGEVVDHLDTLSISVFEDDEEADEQYEIIGEFLAKKKDRKPFTSLRLIGNVDREKYRKFGALLITRTLHSPMGSFQYRRKPTIPEIGICWDFLHHPAIDVKGDFSICVRFDPRRCGVLGNVKTQSIDAIWKGEKRATWLRHHVDGRRDMIPLCSYCEYWGVPTGS
jgi:MoaA/NifB/PqqE/SkfB family radical SAM enzyme